ncbi:hypothetical protein SCLCIDRAFT_122086, partial [Scleroderma citrinum Foug A]
IRKLSFKIVHSSTLLLPTWVATLKDLGMPVKMIPWDVLTHWNSMFDLANFVCEYEMAIESITDKTKLKVTDLALDAHEWALLRQLWDVLKILKDATLYFSCSTPNLAMVIPAMDHIHQELSKYSHDKKYVRSIHAGVSLAKETLNRYYSCTDESEVYCIAMGKLDLFTFVAIN